MLTETEALWQKYKGKNESNFTTACDTSLQSWADWGWKSFFRAGGPAEADGPSQFGAWGSPKTGHGEDWNGTSPPGYYLTQLARTFAPRVVGSQLSMSFDGSTSAFKLEYRVGSRLDPTIPTEIFLWPGRYTGGASVTATATEGEVRVEYDGKASWVRVYPGEALAQGAVVTVHVTKKPEIKKTAAAAPPSELAELNDAPADVCWKDAYGRGVGKVIAACDISKNLVKSGALCYSKCRTDTTPRYYGVGPVCWQHCQPGWVDEGALCRKHGSIETVAKHSYGRGAGTPLTCAAGLQEDAALCYPYCKNGFYGLGPVCWESCPEVNPSDGGAVCCSNGTVCSKKIRDLAGGVPLAVMEALLSGGNPAKMEKAAMDAIDSVLGFVMPKCDKL